MRFILDKLDIEIQEITRSKWNVLTRRKDISEKPVLIFVCGENRYCFTNDERLKIAAIFVSCLKSFTIEFSCNFILKY